VAVVGPLGWSQPYHILYITSHASGYVDLCMGREESHRNESHITTTLLLVLVFNQWERTILSGGGSQSERGRLN